MTGTLSTFPDHLSVVGLRDIYAAILRTHVHWTVQKFYRRIIGAEVMLPVLSGAPYCSTI